MFAKLAVYNACVRLQCNDVGFRNCYTKTGQKILVNTKPISSFAKTTSLYNLVLCVHYHDLLGSLRCLGITILKISQNAYVALCRFLM